MAKGASGLPDPILVASQMFGPSLPLSCLIPIALISLCLCIWAIKKLNDRIAGFLIFAITFRYLLAAFQQWTFRSSPLGLSWNALGSLFVVAIGLVIIQPRQFSLKLLAPIYMLLFVVTISALANSAWSDYLSAATKLSMLLIIFLLTQDALKRVGDKVLTLLLTSLSVPILCFIASIVTHTVKAAESDGSTSYIGGFAHEAPFSIILATGVLIATLSKRIRPIVANSIILALLVAVFIANYRTTILALLPLIATQFLFTVIRPVLPRQRGFISGLTVCVLLLSIGLIGSMDDDRFADLGRVTDLPRLITEPTALMNRDDRRIFSGRVFLWNMNVNGFLNGPQRGYLVGAGPEVRAPGAQIYPHNTLIAALYEYGLAGVVATMLIWVSMLRLAFEVYGWDRYKLIASHISFFILNMATMPFWYVEGLLLYGILCGYTYYSALLARRNYSWDKQSQRRIAAVNGSEFTKLAA